MHSFTTAAALGLAAASVVSAAPARNNKQFPLNENFPFSNPDQIAKIEEEAFGLLPNGAPPATLNDDTFLSVQFINFAEQIESKFFDELLFNITHGVDGYQNIDGDKNFLVGTIKSMRGTEELHTQNAINALKHFQKKGRDVIQPCEYKFPVADFPSALGFIAKVTQFVEGVLGNIVKRAAKNGDAGFTQGVVGAAENEAEQEGFFNFFQKKRPNGKPFETIGSRNFAFSLQQDLVVPGSCPNAFEIANDIKVIQPLNVVGGDPKAMDQDLTFSINIEPTRVAPLPDFKVQSFAKTNAVNDFKSKYGHNNNWSGLFITYLNGQQVPFSVPIKDANLKGTTLTFKAEFPFSQFDMFGLSVAALTTKNFNGVQGADEDSMFDASINGPALILPTENFPGDEISQDNGRAARV